MGSLVDSFCGGSNAEAKILALLVLTIVSWIIVGIVLLYALCYNRRRRMICDQRLNEATEREVVSYQDVNLLLTYMAYLESHGVKMDLPSTASANKTTTAAHNGLINDPKLDAYRNQILSRVLIFFGYESTPVHRAPTTKRSKKSKRDVAVAKKPIVSGNSKKAIEKV